MPGTVAACFMYCTDSGFINKTLVYIYFGGRLITEHGNNESTVMVGWQTYDLCLPHFVRVVWAGMWLEGYFYNALC